MGRATGRRGVDDELATPARDVGMTPRRPRRRYVLLADPWAILRRQIAEARPTIDRFGLGPVVDVDRLALPLLKSRARVCP